MNTIYPNEIIETFVKTYIDSSDMINKCHDIIEEILTTENPKLIDNLYAFINEIKSLPEYKTNYENEKKTLLGYSKRKSNTDRAIYYNYIWNPTHKNLSLGGRNIMFGSGVKMPYEHEGGIPKYQTITIVRKDRCDIEGGDYSPKTANTPEDQLIEDEKAEKKVDKMEIGTALFALAMDLMAIEIDKVDKILVKDAENSDDNSIEVKMIKKATKNFKEKVPLYSYQQRTAEEKLNKKKSIKLKYNLNRIRIPIEQKSGKVGYISKGEFVYPINNVRKMASNKNYVKDVPAQVKIKGELKYLDYQNSKSFLKYKSNSNLILHFEGCLSTFGKSVSPKIDRAYVSPYISKADEVPFKLAEMVDLDDGENSDDIEMSDDDSLEGVKDALDDDDNSQKHVKVIKISDKKEKDKNKKDRHIKIEKLSLENAESDEDDIFDDKKEIVEDTDNEQAETKVEVEVEETEAEEAPKQKPRKSTRKIKPKAQLV